MLAKTSKRSLFSGSSAKFVASNKFNMIPTRGAKIMPRFTFSEDWLCRLNDLKKNRKKGSLSSKLNWWKTILNRFGNLKESLLRVKLDSDKVGLCVSPEAISKYGRWITNNFKYVCVFYKLEFKSRARNLQVKELSISRRSNMIQDKYNQFS